MEVSSEVVWVVASEGWEVGSASWREHGRASRRGSAQRIGVVVDSSVASLRLSRSRLGRRESVSSTESKVPSVLNRGRTSIASNVMSWRNATGAHVVVVGRGLFHEETTCALCRGASRRKARVETGSRTNEPGCDTARDPRAA